MASEGYKVYLVSPRGPPPRPSSYPLLGPKYPPIRDHISPIKGTRRVLAVTDLRSSAVAYGIGPRAVRQPCQSPGSWPFVHEPHAGS